MGRRPSKETEPGTFGFAIMYSRITMDMTQADLAKAVGVTHGYISQLERNLRAPSRALYYKLRVLLSLEDHMFDRHIARRLRGQWRLFNRMEFYIREKGEDGGTVFHFRAIDMTSRQVDFYENYFRYTTFSEPGHEDVPYTVVEFDAGQMDDLEVQFAQVKEEQSTRGATGDYEKKDKIEEQL